MTGPKFPEGTPEYARYLAELKVELEKFARREPPYDTELKPQRGDARRAGFGL